MVYYKYTLEDGKTYAFVSASQEAANRVVDTIMSHGTIVYDFEIISAEEFHQIKGE